MLKKLAAWILAGTALFALSGFVILPPILKSLLISKLSELLHREVAIREIHVNPFALSVGITGFSMMDHGNAGPFLSFAELYLNLESVSLFKGGPVLSDIQLKAPHVLIIRNEDLTYNFWDLLDSLAPKPSVETKLAKYPAYLAKASY